MMRVVTPDSDMDDDSREAGGMDSPDFPDLDDFASDDFVALTPPTPVAPGTLDSPPSDFFDRDVRLNIAEDSTRPMLGRDWRAQRVESPTTAPKPDLPEPNHPLTPADWEAYRGIFTRLYVTEGKTLEGTRQYLSENYGFKATWVTVLLSPEEYANTIQRPNVQKTSRRLGIAKVSSQEGREWPSKSANEPTSLKRC